MTLLKEWEDFEVIYKKVLKDFSRWDKSNLTIIHGRREADIESTYGLPYTSCGDFAGIWNTNCEAKLRTNPLYSFDGLAVDEYGNTVAVLSDKNNKSIYQKSYTLFL